MIYTWKNIPDHDEFLYDVCVIGSGAGGTAAAAHLAERGKKVILIEAGSYLMPKNFSQREEEMFPQLFYDGGGRRSHNKAIRVLHGHGVGGSTVHNINLCKPLPPEILSQWNIKNLSFSSLVPFFEKVERDLSVHTVPEESLNQNNLLFKLGVEKLGYKGGILKHNRKGCFESGFCELGCSFNAKMNGMRVYLPPMIKNGGKLYANCQAQRFKYRGRKISHLEVNVVEPVSLKKVRELKIKAKAFISSAGAIEGPLLLERSQIPDPHRQIGSRLHLHPGVAASGIFEEKVESWMGIPQSYECTEFLDFSTHSKKRTWLVTGSAHPAGVASLLPGFGKSHSEMMKLYPYMASITPMVHDETSGRVSSRFGGGPKIDYVLDKDDRHQLAFGLVEAGKILFAAGAKEVVIPSKKLLRFKNVSELLKSKIEVNDFETDMVAVHPMSSLPMGDDVKTSCTNFQGKYHHLDNLFVADTSLFSTSIGVPPQISTYTFGHWVAKQVDSFIN